MPAWWCGEGCKLSEFERWEARFSVPEYLFGTEPNEFLRANAHLLPARGKALAVADGEGRNGVWLAEQGLDVLSVDFSPTAAFDVVAAIFIQFATPDERKPIFAGIRQALKPGGLLLMQGYRPEQLAYKTGGPSQIENLYTRAMLTEAFAGFADLEISEHDSMTREGAGHSGMAALIDLVGRK